MFNQFCFYIFPDRQTSLFSATQTKKTQDLARISLRGAPVYVGVDDHKDASTRKGLEQVIIQLFLYYKSPII